MARMKAGQKTEGRQKRLSRQALGKLHEAAGLPVLPLDLQRWTLHKVSIPALLPTQGTRPLHKHDPDARFCNPLRLSPLQGLLGLSSWFLSGLCFQSV